MFIPPIIPYDPTAVQIRFQLRELSRLEREWSDMRRRRETVFLRGLNFTGSQVHAFQDRVQGIADRLATVLSRRPA